MYSFPGMFNSIPICPNLFDVLEKKKSCKNNKKSSNVESCE